MKFFKTISAFLLLLPLLGHADPINLSKYGYNQVILENSYAIEAGKRTLYLKHGRPVSYSDRSFFGYYCEINLIPSDLPRVLMPDEKLPILSAEYRIQRKTISHLGDSRFNQYFTIKVWHPIVESIHCARMNDDAPYFWEISGIMLALDRNSMALGMQGQ